jgi:hypothetical protein
MNSKLMQDVEKIVLAGMQMMYDEKTSGMRKALVSRSGATVERIAANAAGLIRMMWEKSGGKMPPMAIGPATMILVFEIASFMNEAGIKVSKDDIEDASHLAAQMVKEIFMKMKRSGQMRRSMPQGQPQGQPVQQQPQPQGLLATGG